MAGNTNPASVKKLVGILALQGNFAKHAEAISHLGVEHRYIRTMEQLSEIDALIIPGGESSALLKLLDNEFREGLKSTVSGGLPTLATCAGAILLANQVSNPKQDSLQLLDISIIRNDYGRQINSFIASNLTLSSLGAQLLQKTGTEILPGIFIRAPKISEVEDNVDILATHEDSAVLIKQDNILVATFHPELNTKNYPIHQLLLSLVK